MWRGSCIVPLDCCVALHLSLFVHQSITSSYRHTNSSSSSSSSASSLAAHPSANPHSSCACPCLPCPVLPACLQCAPPCSCLPLSSPQWWPLTPATSRRASATSPASEPSVLEGVVVVWLAAAGGLSPRSRKHPPPYLLTLAHPSASHLAAGGLMRARMMKSRSCGSRC